MPDRLTERFARYADDLGVRPVVPPQRIRARGERRRRRDAALATIAAVLAIGSVGAVVGVSLTHGSATIQPAGPALPTAFPDSFAMPHEGDPGWTRSDNALAPGAFNPCGGADATLAHRLAAVTMAGPGSPVEQAHSPTYLVEQVLLYDSAAAARAALGALSTAAPRCNWGGGMRDDTVYGAVTLVSYYPANRNVPNLKLIQDATVTQRDNALILKYDQVTGALMSSEDNTAVEVISNNLCGTMGLCEGPDCVIAVPTSRTVRTLCPVPPSAFPTGSGGRPTGSYGPVCGPAGCYSPGPPGGYPSGGYPSGSYGPGCGPAGCYSPGPTGGYPSGGYPSPGPSGSPGPGPHYGPTGPPPT
jgi:hypothetical protein